jgi:hypothetical protein
MSISSEQIKALYNLAKEQKKKYGQLRSVVANVAVNYSLYELLTEEQRQDINDDGILPLFFGEEAVKLTIVQNPFWFWTVVLESIRSKEVSVKRGIAEVRYKYSPVPENRDEAISYGYLLWDSTKKEVVVNAIFQDEVQPKD